MTVIFEGRSLILNKNQEKVLLVLDKKRKNDEAWRRPNKGWLRIDTIQDECCFTKKGTVVGCLQGLKKANLVESISIAQIDNGADIKFYRLTNEFYSYFKTYKKDLWDF